MSSHPIITFKILEPTQRMHVAKHDNQKEVKYIQEYIVSHF